LEKEQLLEQNNNRKFGKTAIRTKQQKICKKQLLEQNNNRKLRKLRKKQVLKQNNGKLVKRQLLEQNNNRKFGKINYWNKTTTEKSKKTNNYWNKTTEKSDKTIIGTKQQQKNRKKPIIRTKK